MKNEIKEQFYLRLTSIRNNIVSDVQFTNGKEIDFNPKVQKSKTGKKEKELKNENL